MRICNNQSSALDGFKSLGSTLRALIIPSAVLIGVAGCLLNAGSEPVITPYETSALANAEPVEPLLIGRARVSYDRPLPAHVTQEFSEEFSLISIRHQADWDEVRRRLRLAQAPPAVDLSRGMIVGLLAQVGEHAGGAWPIHMRAVRTHSGVGAIEATFSPGIYYPLKTAGYLELAYVPGLRTVQIVQIDNRKFVIRSIADLY